MKPTPAWLVQMTCYCESKACSNVLSIKEKAALFAKHNIYMGYFKMLYREIIKSADIQLKTHLKNTI